jgi:hypothetical protein
MLWLYIYIYIYIYISTYYIFYIFTQRRIEVHMHIIVHPRPLIQSLTVIFKKHTAHTPILTRKHCMRTSQTKSARTQQPRRPYPRPAIPCPRSSWCSRASELPVCTRSWRQCMTASRKSGKRAGQVLGVGGERTGNAGRLLNDRKHTIPHSPIIRPWTHMQSCMTIIYGLQTCVLPRMYMYVRSLWHGAYHMISRKINI